MFHTGRKAQDRNKNQAKFLDPKRETHGRLKGLRVLFEILAEPELKLFFTEHSTEIFFVFYEEFTNLELSAKSKGTRLKDELEELLVILEKILLYLPDKVHKRWQFNGIGLILRKLLHHGNIIAEKGTSQDVDFKNQIRELGVRLYMLWLQILQENVDELYIAIFGSIIPGFPSCVDKIDVAATYRLKETVEYLTSSVSGNYSNQNLFAASFESEKEWFVAEGCGPICPPQQGEKVSTADELTKRFLDDVLDHMTRKLLDVQWEERYMREKAFYYMFGHFKRFYLPLIFPKWNPQNHLYNDSDDIITVPLDEEGLKNNKNETPASKHTTIALSCQRAVLCWLVTFTNRLKRRTQTTTVDPFTPQSTGSMTRITSQDSSDSNTLSEDSPAPTSVNTADMVVLPQSKQFEHLCETATIVRAVLYSTQDNVMVVHEIFRQSFLMPLTTVDTMNHVLIVYKEWFFKIQDRPLFMLEPKKTTPIEISNDAENSPMLRTPSYKEAVESCEQVFFANLPVENIRAGFQPNLRLFIAVTAQIFFEKQHKDTLTKHADICKKIMKMYRSIVLETKLGANTWRQLLTVLLKIADHILTVRPPADRHSRLGGHLAGYLLQTLFVTWIRASLQVYLTPDLWDNLLRVCTTFSSWEELIKEWSGTMETLTRVMARMVYGIDLQDPPLQQLTVRDKVKMKRKITEPPSSTSVTDQVVLRNWNRSHGVSKLVRQEQVASASQADDKLPTQPLEAGTIPRSVSEPGFKSDSMRKDISSVLSDSALNRNKHYHVALSDGGEPSEQDIIVARQKLLHKKTLAELADVNNYMTESIDSDTNSVFTHSFNINTNMTLHEALTNEMNKMTNTDSTRDPVIPEVNVEHYNSDTDSEGATSNDNAVIGYEKLTDTNTNSESSSINLIGSVSMNSITSYLSESSQNLLAEFDCDEPEMVVKQRLSYSDVSEDVKSSEKQMEQIIEDDQNEAEVTLVHPAEEQGNHIEEQDERIASYSDTTSTSEDPKQDSTFTQSSISSDQELMPFNLNSAKLDAQSIDSHLFTMIEDESFTELKSPGGLSEEDIVEALDEEGEGEGFSDEEASNRVRFAEASSGRKHSKPEKIKIFERKKSADQNLVSVIEGGTVEGWTPISAVILWRRILGILGNINDIDDPEVHASVYKHLIQIWQHLETIKRNQGVSTDNKSTPPPPALTPPLFFCAPWCFQGMSLDLSTTHKKGRVCSFKLMCKMTVKNHGLKPSTDHMAHFFRLLHDGLICNDQDVVNGIIGECQPFFSLGFDGATCLIMDFIYATTSVINTQYLTYPRKESITILGSMICLPGVYHSMKIFHPISSHDQALQGRELRERILIPILKAVKNDPSSRARCIALNCLGMFIVESLVQLGGHPRIYECLALLISSLEFHSVVVSTVALDVLWTLTFYFDYLAKFDADLPLKIVEAMCQVALHLQIARKTSTSDIPKDEEPTFISKLLLCLLDWCMVLPHEMLLRKRMERENNFTYLALVMKLLKKCSEDKSEKLFLERRRSTNISQIFIGDSRPMRLARVHDDLSLEEKAGSTEDEPDFLSGMSHPETNVLHLTAEYAISQILNYYQQFPFDTGAVQPSSRILENDDNVTTTDDLSTVLETNNVQFVLVDDKVVLSVVELPQIPKFNETSGYEASKTVSRLVIRDHCGKYCWDMGDLFVNKNNEDEKTTPIPDTLHPRSTSLTRKHSRNLSVTISRSTHNHSSSLPTWNTVDPNADCVDQLLRYIGESSPECLLFSDQKLNTPAPVPNPIDLTVQSSIVTSVLKQHNEEENYVHEISHDPRITATEISPPEYSDPTSPYHVSKMILHQLGFFSWHKRRRVELLERNEKLIRDIKNLDNRPCRETQKIAVFYVAAGQEDKQSILSNSKASVKFEEFLAAMAWEVDLATHTGFMGGLESNLSTGKSAPYFATPALEVIFHVSTRIPGLDEEHLKTKLRHLGNDEVHIIWSEHNRDFRRGIINTEFGDVLIIIYPMDNNLYRIQIDRNPKIPPFGPLFDGAIVDGVLLPVLVRSTAISAGRAKRSTLPFYKRHFEERARCINDISRSRVRHTSFEEFTASLFSPGKPAMHTTGDSTDGLHRTFSAPTRPSISSDTSSVLKLLDMPETFRSRTASSALRQEGRVARASSNTSLNNIAVHADDGMGVFSDTDSRDLKDARRRSITKRMKKKVSSVEIPFPFGDKSSTSGGGGE